MSVYVPKQPHRVVVETPTGSVELYAEQVVFDGAGVEPTVHVRLSEEAMAGLVHEGGRRIAEKAGLA